MSKNRQRKLTYTKRRKLDAKEKILKECTECGISVSLDSKTEVPEIAGFLCSECGAKKETVLTFEQTRAAKL